MLENLVKLYNTLKTISTKGDDTKVMGSCLTFIEQMIYEERSKQTAPAAEPTQE